MVSFWLPALISYSWGDAYLYNCIFFFLIFLGLHRKPVKTASMIIILYIRVVKKTEVTTQYSQSLFYPAILSFQTEIADVSTYKCLCYVISCIGILPQNSLDFFFPCCLFAGLG